MKLPLKAESLGRFSGVRRARLLDATGTWIAEVEHAEDDADFIVRAVNAHNELVEALQEIVKIIPRIGDAIEPAYWHQFKRAQAALAKAKGETYEISNRLQKLEGA